MNSVTSSIPQIINLIILLILVFFLFAIVGIQLFKGTYWYCDASHIDDLSVEKFRTIIDLSIFEKLNKEEITDKLICMDYGGDWIQEDSNFDNCVFALITMFKVALTEGWLDIMWKPVDIKGSDVYTLFFITFIFVGSFFLLNLFDGIVIDNYYREKERVLGIGDFSAGQRLWIQLQSKVGTQKPKFEVTIPKIKWQAFLYKFVTSVYFESFIILVIVINMIVFMISSHRESQSILDGTAIFN